MKTGSHNATTLPPRYDIRVARRRSPFRFVLAVAAATAAIAHIPVAGPHLQQAGLQQGGGEHVDQPVLVGLGIPAALGGELREQVWSGQHPAGVRAARLLDVGT
jgi:hypothetical protein